MMATPSDEITRYVSRFGISGVYLAGAPSITPPVVVGTAVDLQRTLRWIGKHAGGNLFACESPALRAVWWKLSSTTCVPHTRATACCTRAPTRLRPRCNGSRSGAASASRNT